MRASVNPAKARSAGRSLRPSWTGFRGRSFHDAEPDEGATGCPALMLSRRDQSAWPRGVGQVRIWPQRGVMQNAPSHCLIHDNIRRRFRVPACRDPPVSNTSAGARGDQSPSRRPVATHLPPQPPHRGPIKGKGSGSPKTRAITKVSGPPNPVRRNLRRMATPAQHILARPDHRSRRRFGRLAPSRLFRGIGPAVCPHRAVGRAGLRRGIIMAAQTSKPFVVTARQSAATPPRHLALRVRFRSGPNAPRASVLILALDPANAAACSPWPAPHAAVGPFNTK